MTRDLVKPVLDLLRDGCHKEASRAARRALAAPGLALEDQIDLVAAMADASWHLSELSEAESHFRRALELAEGGLGAGHAVCNVRRYDLATFLSSQGRMEEAIEVLRRFPDAKAIDDALRDIALADMDPKWRGSAREALTRALAGGNAAQQELLAVLLELLGDLEDGRPDDG